MDSLDKLWEDLQNRASSVLDKSHVLLKYVALVAITFFAFSLRLVGFLRVRGSNELEDIFNLAMTDRLSSSGLATFFHEQSSVPEGSVLYPGLVAFINATQCLLGHAGVVFSVQTLYTLAGPFFAACSAVATYLLGKELKDEVTGLVAAGILSLLPGFFALSVDGRNSNVVGGTFFAILVVLAFVRAVKSQSPLQAFFAGVAYFCLSSFWSGHVFIQLLLSAYVVVLLCLDKCAASVHTAYSVFFIVSNVLNILLPSGGFMPFLNAEFYLGFGVFVLLQLGTYVKLQGSLLPAAGLAFAVIIGVASMLFGLKSSPAFSVFWAQFAAGNGSSWLTFFRDLHLVLFLFPAGVFLCFRKKSNVNVFFTVYAALALFVSSVSANFVAVLFPVAAVLASLGLTSTVKTYLRNQEAPVKKASSKPISKEINVAALAGMAAVAGFFLVYSFSAATHPTIYQQTTVFPAVSQTNNEFLKVDDLREAVSWLQHNTPNDTQVVTWRGLGQQVANIARLSVLGTDSTRPHQNLAQVAQVFQADEKTAAAKVAELGAQYVLVIFGGATGFPSDDLSRSHEISSEGHFSEESLLFKLAYKGFADLPTRPSDHPGFDLARQHAVSFRPELSHFAEVFTSEHWLVRIFELSPPASDTEVEETAD